MSLSRGLAPADQFSFFEKLKVAEEIITPNYLIRLAAVPDPKEVELGDIQIDYTGIKEAVDEIFRRDREGILYGLSKNSLIDALDVDDLLKIIDTLLEGFQRRGPGAKMSLQYVFDLMRSVYKQNVGITSETPKGTRKIQEETKTIDIEPDGEKTIVDAPKELEFPRNEIVLTPEQHFELANLPLADGEVFAPINHEKIKTNVTVPFHEKKTNMRLETLPDEAPKTLSEEAPQTEEDSLDEAPLSFKKKRTSELIAGSVNKSFAAQNEETSTNRNTKELLFNQLLDDIDRLQRRDEAAAGLDRGMGSVPQFGTPTQNSEKEEEIDSSKPTLNELPLTLHDPTHTKESPKKSDFNSVERLKQLREILPTENFYDFPPGSLAAEDAKEKDLEGEYQEQINRALENQIQSEEEYVNLQKHVGDPADLSSEEVLLLGNGVTPLRISENDSSELGEGHFSTVYNAVYNGKEVAAKVTKQEEFRGFLNDEAYVWKQILKIKDDLSPETQKHLPKIYKIIEGQEEDQQIIIMEKLAPVPRDLLKAVGIYGTYASRSTANLFKDPKLLNEIFNQSTTPMYKDLSTKEQDLLHSAFINYKPSGKHIATRELFEYLQHAVLKGIFRPNESLGEDIEKIIQKNINQPWAEEYGQDPKTTMVDVVNQIGEDRFDRIRETTFWIAQNAADYILNYSLAEIPAGYGKLSENRKEILLQIPEAKSFFEALTELAANGIEWKDLHSGNILMRPATKELVIIDVGLYNAPDKANRKATYQPPSEGNYYKPELGNSEMYDDEFIELPYADDVNAIDNDWRVLSFNKKRLGLVSTSELSTKSPPNNPTVIQLPNVRQSSTYSCGAAALQAVLVYYGKSDVGESKIKEALGTTADGTTPGDIKKVAEAFDLIANIRTNMNLDDLKGFVDNDIPVMVAYQAWRDKNNTTPWNDNWDDGHWSVVIGMDDDFIYFEDPALIGSIGYLYQEEFIERWHDVDRGEKLMGLGIVITSPDPIPKTEPIIPIE